MALKAAWRRRMRPERRVSRVAKRHSPNAREASGFSPNTVHLMITFGEIR
jgi:hypothetical protein